MKKTLIAIAALAATGAFAQSSVTISGMVDATYNTKSIGGGAVTNEIGSVTASRFRFVGSEDMGGGNKANFWLEMQPNINDGSISGAAFNRGAWGGLSGGWGEVRLGRMGTNTISAVVLPDVQQGGAFYGFYGGGLLFSGMAAPGNLGSMWFAANPTRGSNTANYATSTGNAALGGTGGDSTRYTRAIRYSTPKFLDDSLAVNVTNAYGTTGGGSGGGSLGFDVAYAKGALRAALAYQKANAETTDAGQNAGSLTTASFNYDLGKFIVGGALQSEKASGANVVFNSGKSFGLVGMLPLGAARPYIKLGTHSYDTMGTNVNMFNLGSTYNLSKNTLVYVDYARNNATNTGTAVGATAPTAPRIFVLGTQINF